MKCIAISINIKTNENNEPVNKTVSIKKTVYAAVSIKTTNSKKLNSSTQIKEVQLMIHSSKYQPCSLLLFILNNLR